MECRHVGENGVQTCRGEWSADMYACVKDGKWRFQIRCPCNKIVLLNCFPPHFPLPLPSTRLPPLSLLPNTLTGMRSSVELQQQNETEVSDDGEGESSHNPVEHGTVEPVRAQVQCNSCTKRNNVAESLVILATTELASSN